MADKMKIEKIFLIKKVKSDANKNAPLLFTIYKYFCIIQITA